MSQYPQISAVHFLVDNEVYPVTVSNLDGYAWLNSGDSTFLMVAGEAWQIQVDHKLMSPVTEANTSPWSLVVIGSRVVESNDQLKKLLNKQ